MLKETADKKKTEARPDSEAPLPASAAAADLLLRYGGAWYLCEIQIPERGTSVRIELIETNFDSLVLNCIEAKFCK